MDSGKSSSNLTAPTWGSFALVTYLPEPLGSFLADLRRALPGDSHPDPHITFLPPRELSGTIEETLLAIKYVLQAVQSFELSLGGVQVFPGTKVIYLDVDAGRKDLENLHASLNQGVLFAPEDFEYIPHLTLGGPLDLDVEEAAVQKVQSDWNKGRLSRRFLVEEVVLLWQPGPYSERAWTRLSAHRLQAVSSSSLATQT